MQIKITRTRLVTETAIVEVTDDQLRDADIDPDEITDVDVAEVYEAAEHLFRYAGWETDGWEEAGDPQVEVYSYS